MYVELHNTKEANQVHDSHLHTVYKEWFHVMELWWHVHGTQDYDAFQNYATVVFIKCEPLARNSWTFAREMCGYSLKEEY